MRGLWRFQHVRRYSYNFSLFLRGCIASRNSFFRYRRRIHKVNGWLADQEAEWLFNTARDKAAGGHIVEIGSWEGKSTVCLALGAKAGGHNRCKIFAVDPHCGGIGLVKSIPDLSERMFVSLASFQNNISRFGVLNHVVPFVMTSRTAAQNWQYGEISLLFVDGWHSFEECYCDIVSWAPHMGKGGIIAVHDYTWPDVARAIDASMLDLKDCGKLDLIGPNLAYFHV